MLVQGEIVINRPIDEVFDFVADERNEPKYNPEMTLAEMVTPGPIGLGSKFYTVMTGARAADMTVEFTEFDRPRRLGSTTRIANMDINGTLLFEPQGQSTKMNGSGISSLVASSSCSGPLCVEWASARNWPSGQA